MVHTDARPAQHDHEDHERHRGELLAHCYRMLGSYDEAEDVVQETMVRAWRASDRYDPARASMRTWLYSIATNACLTALKQRQRRPLPSGLGPPGADASVPLVPNLDLPWLQPFPDSALGDPENLVLQRAALRLGFVVVLQLLPPRQRAALLLREVMQMSAAEVASVLGSSVASVNSSLQRARSTVRTASPRLESLSDPADPDEQAVVEEYLRAFEAADLARLSKLLADDVALEMPPVDLWLQGRDAYLRFLTRVFTMRGTSWRMQIAHANGGPALAAFAPDPGSTTGLRAHSIQAFDIRGSLVQRCVTFVDPDLVTRFVAE